MIIKCAWFSGLVWVLVPSVVRGCFLAPASVRPRAQCFSPFLYNKTSEKLRVSLSFRALGKPDPGLPEWRPVAALPLMSAGSGQASPATYSPEGPCGRLRLPGIVLHLQKQDGALTRPAGDDGGNGRGGLAAQAPHLWGRGERWAWGALRMRLTSPNLNVRAARRRASNPDFPTDVPWRCVKK